MICRPSGPSPTFGYNSTLAQALHMNNSEHYIDVLPYVTIKARTPKLDIDFVPSKLEETIYSLGRYYLESSRAEMLRIGVKQVE